MEYLLLIPAVCVCYVLAMRYRDRQTLRYLQGAYESARPLLIANKRGALVVYISRIDSKTIKYVTVAGFEHEVSVAEFLEMYHAA